MKHISTGNNPYHKQLIGRCEIKFDFFTHRYASHIIVQYSAGSVKN
jgi:hypothetical protein